MTRVAPVVLITGAIGSFVVCSKAQTPVAPSPPTSPFIGRWTGAIVSEAIGAGVFSMVIDSAHGPPSALLLAGTWSFSFEKPKFTGQGSVEGSLSASGDVLGLFFSRTVVPCPGEPEGVAHKVIAASMTHRGDQLNGDYVVAGCPGGQLDLRRR